MSDIMKMGKNPNYLGSWDLEEQPNREVILTIDNIRDEEVVTNGKTENCTVCYWTDHAYKPMIMNITNKKRLCKLYRTKETEKLRGKSVVIGIEKVKAFGAVHDALRICPRVPQIRTAALPKCSKCGADIMPTNRMTAEQIAEYTINKCGRPLCAACCTSSTKEAQNAANQG
ncbi:MAG: hypothetical protein K2H01_04750 [Ruminococcus sp.]|nr:hypothetical protein [Ruminococcus sp.]